eukprot:gnl/TRDRNA2_/TRDRNA2_93533_c0_seq1.p1 gnl/TRDRNA2_/TRDRNA2_93533_c0~~gnl/TRDRNA2_/TRDRNA2_93533_c0_seq1.p1  ORF type:complete len:223 (+),score=35.25 gnl/TRDRNA2_/TRDRNA2_93533_c0_seq1:137-805(+)
MGSTGIPFVTELLHGGGWGIVEIAEDIQNLWWEDQSETDAGANAATAAAMQGYEEYLETIGYAAKHPRGLLEISVETHEEVNGHTMYIIACSFCGSRESWVCQKRLCEIREELHDDLKMRLGDFYGCHFAETPFAMHGGLPGTTARLHAWFKTLAALMNSGDVMPNLCAFVLRFLDTPPVKKVPAASVADGKGAAEGDVVADSEPGHEKTISADAGGVVVEY